MTASRLARPALSTRTRRMVRASFSTQRMATAPALPSAARALAPEAPPPMVTRTDDKPSSPPQLSLERYAALRAELQVATSEEEREEVRVRYGLTAVAEKEEVRAWTFRFDEDRFAFADYLQLFARLRKGFRDRRRAVA